MKEEAKERINLIIEGYNNEKGILARGLVKEDISIYDDHRIRERLGEIDEQILKVLN